MGGIVVWPPGRTAVMELINSYLTHKAVPGGTAKGTARNQALHDGFIDGINEALAAIGSEERTKMFLAMNPDLAKERYVPSVASYTVAVWMRELKDSLASDDKVNLEVLDLSFHDEVVLDKDFREFLHMVRRDSIKSGRMEPDESDRAWIQEEYETYSTLTTPIKSLLDKLGGPKTDA